MVPSQSRLAELLNSFAAANRVVISEATSRLAVNQLVGSEAEQVVDLLEASGWSEVLVEDQGGEIPRAYLASSGGGVRVSATRPTVPNNVEAVLTSAGFSALLDRTPTSALVWVEGLSSPIDTRTVRYAPWGNTDLFEVTDQPLNPTKVVRVLGQNGPGTNIGRWLLRAPATDVSTSVLAPWRVRAASRLLRSLAQEIEPDEKLLFKGPPTARFTVLANEELAAHYFAATQSIAGWVFENDREVENRHALLAAEIARTALRDGDARDLASVLMPALEGARIAYNFGVTQQSRDTLKALGDLRKAVSEDTAKLSETTRTLAAAVITAVFGNIGLILTRLTLPPNNTFVGPAAILLGTVLSIYVMAMIGSGWHFMSVQRDLRREWRGRLYRFLPDGDYRRLVDTPIKKAEVAFWCTAGVGVLMTGLLWIAVRYIAKATLP